MNDPLIRARLLYAASIEAVARAYNQILINRNIP
jgi:hypothetical protein